MDGTDVGMVQRGSVPGLEDPARHRQEGISGRQNGRETYPRPYRQRPFRHRRVFRRCDSAISCGQSVDRSWARAAHVTAREESSQRRRTFACQLCHNMRSKKSETPGRCTVPSWPPRARFSLLVHLVVSTIGITEESCRLIKRSIWRSIWYHNSTFFAEITFSKIGTYLRRSASNWRSTSVALCT